MLAIHMPSCRRRRGGRLHHSDGAWGAMPGQRRGGRPPSHDIGAWLVGEAELRAALDDLHRIGAILLTGLAPTAAATEAALSRLGTLCSTIFGTLWTFTADSAHADSACDCRAIPPHTDGTYERDPRGLQAFHVLRPASSGGVTGLVDGLRWALALATDHPDAVALLAATPLPARYTEPGVDRRVAHPVFDAAAGEASLLHRLRVVHWNPADRTPHLPAPADADHLLDALSLAEHRLSEPARRVDVHLQPGELLLIDNHRALHSRTAFSGERAVCGAHLGRATWESRWRTTRPK